MSQVLAGPLSARGGGATLDVVDTRSEIREFLTSRRARITPEQAGLRIYGTARAACPAFAAKRSRCSPASASTTTPGSSAATRAGVSDTVLDALARALQLDDAERAHLFDLARAARNPRRPAAPARAQQRIRPSVQHMLDAMTGAPAFVRNGRLDILAANRLGRALYSRALRQPAQPPNTARFVFLDPRATDLLRRLGPVAHDVVAVLRAEAGRDPYDRDLSDLVGELSTRSELFRTLWAAHNVRRHDTGLKRFHHPVVGELDLTFEAMELVADPGLTMFVYTAEPGSKSEEALNLLASWTATPDVETAGAP